MKDEIRMLKTILKSSGWSQERLAGELGVSFATVNSWLNGKTKPRDSVTGRIRGLYLAKEIEYKGDPIYVTLVLNTENLKTGDVLLLEKDLNSRFDDESIAATLFDNLADKKKCSAKKMYVANSVESVVRGTWSAGRLYDKVKGVAKARVEFIGNNFAIAKVVDFGGE